MLLLMLLQINVVFCESVVVRNGEKRSCDTQGSGDEGEPEPSKPTTILNQQIESEKIQRKLKNQAVDEQVGVEFGAAG